MDEKDSTAKLVARMDGVADALLALIGKEETSDAQKGRLFTTVQSWMKLRQTLVPSGEGDKLKGMSDAIKSSGRGGKRNSGRSDRTAKDGAAIRSIIKSLPKRGNDDVDEGDTENPVGADVGGAGIGGSISVDGSGAGVVNVDGARNLN